MTYVPSITINADTGIGTLQIGANYVFTTSATAFAISTFALHQRSGNSTQVIDNLAVIRAVPDPSALLTF